MKPAPVHFRLFLSSPGDVQDERSLARKVVTGLQYQPFIRNRATLQVISWDDPNANTPVYANLTPQAALARQLPRPAECDIVIVILWSRMGTPLPDDAYRKPEGGSYLSGTEWEFEDAVRSGRKPVVLVYRRTEKPKIDLDDPELQTKQAQYRLVKQFFERFTNSDGSLRGGYVEYDSPSDFERRLDNDIKSVLEDLLMKAASVESPISAHDAVRFEGSPYPGLRRFTEEDVSIFFGRGREVDALIQLLNDGKRFLSVIGASGSGKSSLVRAGLLPRLRGNAVAGSKDWRIGSFSPADFGDNPFLALAAALAPLMPAGPRAPLTLAEQIAKDPNYAAKLCTDALSGRPDWADVLLFIDQMEELFTITRPEWQDAFISSILALASHQRVVLVSTLRTDFFPNASRWSGFVDLLQAGNYLLMPPGLRALSDMVRLPAQKAGLEIEDGLLDRIIEDTGLQPGALPLLAYTLEQLHNAERHSRKLTQLAYDTLGGIRGAISKRADEIFQALDQNAQSTLPKLFRQLLTINSSGIVTRRRALKLEVATDSATEQLVNKLIDARLLIADRRDNENTIEVTHEALFEGWDRMRLWINENREFLLWRNRLRFRLDEWQATGRDESAVLQGAALTEARRWLEQHGEDLTPAERTFIQWPLSDEYQVRKVIAEARDLLLSSGDRTTDGHRAEWLANLIVAGEDAEAETIAERTSWFEAFGAARAYAAVWLGQAGHYDDALAIVRQIQGIPRMEACAQLAASASHQGDWAHALASVELIEDQKISMYALARAAVADDAPRENLGKFIEKLLSLEPADPKVLEAPVPVLLKALARCGRWEQAALLAQSASTVVTRAALLSEIVKALCHDRMVDAVRIVCSTLHTVAREIEDASWRDVVMTRTAFVLASGDLPSEAEQFANLIESQERRDGALVALAGAKARLGGYAEAAEMATQVVRRNRSAGPTVRITDMVLSLAAQFTRAGHHAEAANLAQEMLDAATAAQDVSTRAASVCRIAEVFALCKQLDKAREALGYIGFPSWHAHAIEIATLALVDQKDFQRALDLSRSTKAHSQRAGLLAKIAEALASNGEADSAGKVADEAIVELDEIPSRKKPYCRTLVGLAGSLILCGKKPELLIAARAIESRLEAAHALISIMRELAMSGRGGEAVALANEAADLAEKIDDYDDRARGYAALSKVLAQCNRREEARHQAGKCHLPNEKLEAYSAILRSWIAQRSMELAEVTHKIHRSRAFSV